MNLLNNTLKINIDIEKFKIYHFFILKIIIIWIKLSKIEDFLFFSLIKYNFVQ